MCCQQLHKEVVHQASVAFDYFSGEVVLDEAGNCDFGLDKVLNPSQRETRLPTLPRWSLGFFSPAKDFDVLLFKAFKVVHDGVKLAREIFPNAED